MTEGTLRGFLRHLDRENKENVLKYLQSDSTKSITKIVIEKIIGSDKELSIPLLLSYIPKFVELKLNDTQIDLIINTYFSHHCLDELCTGFSLGFNMEQMKLLANPAYTDEQMREITFGFINGLDFSYVESYANPHISNYKMYVKRVCKIKGFSDADIASILNLSESDFKKMKEANIEKYCLEPNQIKFACVHSNNSKQFIQIILGFADNLLEKEIKVYADPIRFDAAKMEFLRQALKTDMPLSDKALNFISTCSDFSSDQLSEIIDGFKANLTVDQVRIYAKTFIDPQVMHLIKYDICNQIYLGDVKFYTFENGAYVDLIRSYIKKGVSKERILNLTYSFSSSQVRNMSFVDILESALSGLSCKQIMTYSNKMLFECIDVKERERLILMCKSGITADNAQYILEKEEKENFDDKIIELFLN